MAPSVFSNVYLQSPLWLG